jgi:hypothetical protein
MGRPKKDPALVRSVPLNFRVSKAVKDAIDTMIARREADMGDDSLTGWFMALVHREAKRLDVPIVTAAELKAAPAKRKALARGRTARPRR